jgi:hypothetical protein
MIDDDRKRAETEADDPVPDDYSDICNSCGVPLTASEMRDGYDVCRRCEDDYFSTWEDLA